MNKSAVDGAAISGAIAGGLASHSDIDVSEQHSFAGREQFALEVAGVGVWEYDAASGQFTLDGIERQLRGLEGDPARPSPEHMVLSTIVADGRDRVRDSLSNAAAQGCGFDELFQVQVAGEMRWLHSIGQLVPGSGADGGTRLIGVSFDASAEGQALAARDLLLREMNHRIKNLFAVIGGMISLCAREAESPRALSEDLGKRIAAMGRAHALTQQTMVERALDLRELVEAVIEPSRMDQSIVIEGRAIKLPIALVTPLALIFHEWATNAAKYGALADADGALTVRWIGDGNGVTTIEWAEICSFGLGLAPGGAGFGTRLIEATVAQLRAKLTSEHHDGVLMHRLELPGLG